MINKLSTLLLMGFLSTAALAQAPADTPGNAGGSLVAAGKVDLVEGDVRILDRQQKSRLPNVGDTVNEGDSVVTGSDGELHLTMEDEGFIAIRPNTRMSIAEFRAQGDERDKGVFSLIAGSMRSVTGWIGKYHPRSYSIRTPNATIGIRGTDHEPLVIPQGSTEGEPGTYDKVNVGGSYIQTAQGRIDIAERRAAFAPQSGKRGKLRPRLLADVPRFYRTTRNERLIDRKHAFIQGILESRREQRRQKIKDRLKPLENGNASADRPGHEKAQERAAKREANRAQKRSRRQQMQEERKQRNKEDVRSKKKKNDADQSS